MTIFALNARCQRGLLLLLLLVNFTGCSIFGGKEEDTEREKTRALTETQLYNRVQELLDDKSYDLAVRNLQLLESRFPFGSYAEQAQLEIVYAYHKSGDDDAAIAAAERFLRLHPGHPDADCLCCPADPSHSDIPVSDRRFRFCPEFHSHRPAGASGQCPDGFQPGAYGTGDSSGSRPASVIDCLMLT